MRLQQREPKRSMAACRLCAGALLLAIWPAGALPQNVPTANTAREAELWGRITELSALPAASQPQADWFAALQRRRADLAREAHAYQQLYPGGEHCDDALRLELTALFELGTVREGNLEQLCRRTAEVLAAPPTAVAQAEAAYWSILCRRTGRLPATQPAAPREAAGGELGVPDADLLANYAEYVRRYPDSRYVPRLCTHLYAAAERSADLQQMQQLVAHLAATFPQHAITAELSGKLRLRMARGTPFWPEWTDLDGQTLRAEDYRGQHVAVLVWKSSEPEGRAAADALRSVQAANPQVRVISVSLDAQREQARDAAAGMGGNWPVVHDGLGWGGPFVRSWGLRAAPTLLVIDPAGRLACICGPADIDECVSTLRAGR